jgi:uncharacterized DUF497 family protein
MVFRWDPAKAEANRLKHGVALHDAATGFQDPLATTFPDPDHSLGESRYVTVGMGETGCLLVVAHTEEEDEIRIISARCATPRERRFYEEGPSPRGR